jgi:hypothetical protein
VLGIELAECQEEVRRREIGGGGALIIHCVDYKVLGIELAKC